MRRALLLTLVLACAEAPAKPEESPVAAQPPPALPEGVKAAPAPEVPKVSDTEKARSKDDLEQALKKIDSGNRDEALQLAQEAADKDPGNADAASLAGELLLLKGDEDAALRRLQGAVRARADHPASENLTRLLLKRGRVSEAEKDLAARVAQKPASLSLRVQYVRVLIAESRLDQALTEAKKVLKADERNVPALQALADVWYREKKFELARDVLENAAALDPKNGETANAQGFVHLALDQKPLALESFKRACELSPALAEAHNNLGALLNEANDYDGAAHELEIASKLQPERPAIWLNLGNAYRGARRDEEAQHAYEKALQLDPKNPDPLFNLGILYLDGQFPKKPPAERLSEALSWFGKFKSAGGTDSRLARYESEADKGVKKEKDRAVREERDKLKKAEGARKAEEDRKRREASKIGHEEEDEGPAPKAPAAQRAPPAQKAPVAAPPPPRSNGKLGGSEDEK